MGESTGIYCALLKKPEGKSPLGRPRPRLEDNIQELKYEGMDWIDLAQDRDR